MLLIVYVPKGAYKKVCFCPTFQWELEMGAVASTRRHYYIYIYIMAKTQNIVPGIITQGNTHTTPCGVNFWAGFLQSKGQRGAHATRRVVVALERGRTCISADTSLRDCLQSGPDYRGRQWGVYLGCLRFIKLSCWVGLHINIIMKPPISPTQGQPNPRKSRLKVAFWPLFPTKKIFLRGLGLVLYRKQITKNLT